MSCQRCSGLCVSGYLIERGQHVPVLKCVNCGNMVDLQIMANQIKQNRAEQAKKRVLPPLPHAISGYPIAV